MKFLSRGVVLASLAAIVWSATWSSAQEKKRSAFQVEGNLTNTDQKDKVRTDCYHKSYEFKMEEGKTYQIDLKSKEFDPWLRLLDPDGKQVAEDDDGGEDLDSRIVYKAKKSGAYRIIVTTFGDGETGRFFLTAEEKK